MMTYSEMEPVSYTHLDVYKRQSKDKDSDLSKMAEKIIKKPRILCKIN